jgi:hypothetical protein
MSLAGKIWTGVIAVALAIGLWFGVNYKFEGTWTGNEKDLAQTLMDLNPNVPEEQLPLLQKMADCFAPQAAVVLDAVKCPHTYSVVNDIPPLEQIKLCLQTYPGVGFFLDMIFGECADQVLKDAGLAQ